MWLSHYRVMHVLFAVWIFYFFFSPRFGTAVAGVSDLRSSSFQSAERSCANTSDTKVMSVAASKLLWKSIAAGFPVDVFSFFSSSKTHLKHHYRQNKLSLATETLWVVAESEAFWSFFFYCSQGLVVHTFLSMTMMVERLSCWFPPHVLVTQQNIALLQNDTFLGRCCWSVSITVDVSSRNPQF